MTLHLFVLMLSLLSGGSARVVQDFEQECGQFFANGKSPTRRPEPQYRQICQNLDNIYYYATYYDTYNRIPVYSAYKFAGKMDCDRLDKWLIEPQLDDDKGGPSMASEGSVDIKLRGIHQALKGDYVKSGYHRGHLAPVYHAQSRDCANATFTLTNAAPQDSSFNSGQWRVLERNIANNLTEQCLQNYSVFIVTGPSHFWTAYCCLDQNNRCQISRGFIGVNKNKIPLNITVNDLEKQLANLYKVASFEVFDSSTVPPIKQKSKAFRINVTCGQFWFSFLCILFLFYLPS